MPELPEVETIVRDLQGRVAGARIEDVRVVKPDLIGGDLDQFQAACRGRIVRSVSRRAKNIVFDLDQKRLVINLGMTGRLIIVAGSDQDPEYTGARFTLADGRSIVYQDVRRFGLLRALPTPEWEAHAAGMGLEPLSEEFDADRLRAMTRRSRVAIKTWLMDQKRVVGIGNIYASEALFRAGISPRKAARSLKVREAAALHQSIREVLQEAIDFRGTTLLDYRDAAGNPGEFSRRLRVYGRRGDPCLVCETPIGRIVQGGRSTFFCPTCQK